MGFINKDKITISNNISTSYFSFKYFLNLYYLLFRYFL